MARDAVQRRYAPKQQAPSVRQAPQLKDQLDADTLQTAQFYFRFYWALQRCLCFNEWLVRACLEFHRFNTHPAIGLCLQLNCLRHF
jgi:hypothetical protein